MTTDDVVSCLFEARAQLFEARAAAAEAGLDWDFDDLIIRLEVFTYNVVNNQGGE